MAITLAKVNLDKRVHVKGNRWEVITDATLDNSYPTGGYALTYKKLGIDYEKEYISNIGRPFKLADKGKPIDFLLV